MRAMIAKNIAKIADQMGVRADGWYNVLTHLGVKGKDKRMSAQIDWSVPVEMDLDALYASDDIAAKVVDLVPEDALREGLAFPKMEQEEQKKLTDEMERLLLLPRFQSAWSKARLAGGAGLLMVTDDSADWEEPLNLERVGELRALHPLTRWEMMPMDYISDLGDPNFGMPAYYQLQPRIAQSGETLIRVHSSRVVRFDGAALPIRMQLQNNRWNDSVLTRVKPALMNFATSYDSAASALQDFRFNIFKLKNLAELIGGGQDEVVTKRLGLINMAKSIARAVVIDADEEFTTETTVLTGISEILQEMKTRLQGAASMPHTKLFGESPSGGLGSNGEHQEANWNAVIRKEQKGYATPRLNQIFPVIFAQRRGPFAGVPPKDFTYTFPPLWQLDEKEQADLRKTIAEADAIYIDRQVTDPAEVAMSRFGGDEFSMETKLMQPRSLESELPGTQRAAEAAAALPPPEPGAAKPGEEKKPGAEAAGG